MKRYLKLGVVAMSLLATGCSNDLVPNSSDIENEGKEKIVLASGESNAALTTRAGFKDNTRIVARFVADKRGGASTDAKCITTALTAIKDDAQTENSYSNVEYVTGKDRYWEDAYARNSIISVYAVAVPNKDNVDLTLDGTEEWSSDKVNNNNISWTVKPTQTTDVLANEDLTYSNNIQQTGKKGVYIWNGTAYPVGPENAKEHSYEEDGATKTDGRLYYTVNNVALNADAESATGGHYDRGQMEFKHALSRIQINLKKGEGFAADYTLALTGDMLVKGMPYTGTLDVKAGIWSVDEGRTDFTAAKWATADTKEYTTYKADLTYEAQVAPSYEFVDNANNVLEFTVAGNKYGITNATLRNAIGGEANAKMEQGKRYVFNITVAKNKIQNVTATVLDWVDVAGEEIEMDNSHVKFTFLSPTGTSCGIEDINFYRYGQGLDKVYTDNTYEAPATASSGKVFEGPATLSDEGNDGKFETNWYYEDNKTAYHFRTLNDAAANTFDGTSKDKFTMTAASSVDYHWGAPMKTDAMLAYDWTNGFADNIAKGVVSATKDTELKVQEIHMMSNIIVKLKSNPETGDAAINLSDAEVTITDLYTTASVDMGTGKITATGDLGNNVMTAADEGKTHTFSVIPQILERKSGEKRYVGITIKVAGNEYHIVEELKAIKDASNNPITEWLPGHTYTYTFTLSKKKIEVITATIAQWIPVNGENVNIGLEK